MPDATIGEDDFDMWELVWAKSKVKDDWWPCQICEVPDSKYDVDLTGTIKLGKGEHCVYWFGQRNYSKVQHGKCKKKTFEKALKDVDDFRSKKWPGAPRPKSAAGKAKGKASPAEKEKPSNAAAKSKEKESNSDTVGDADVDKPAEKKQKPNPKEDEKSKEESAKQGNKEKAIEKASKEKSGDKSKISKVDDEKTNQESAANEESNTADSSNQRSEKNSKQEDKEKSKQQELTSVSKIAEKGKAKQTDKDSPKEELAQKGKQPKDDKDKTKHDAKSKASQDEPEKKKDEERDGKDVAQRKRKADEEKPAAKSSRRKSVADSRGGDDGTESPSDSGVKVRRKDEVCAAADESDSSVIRTKPGRKPGPKSDSDSESSGKGEHDSRHSTKSHHQPPQRSKGDVNGASKSGGGAGKARGTDHERDKGSKQLKSPFFRFCEIHRPKLKAAEPDISYSMLDSKLKAMWAAAQGTPERTRLEREHQEASEPAERGKDKDEADKKSVTERLNRLAAQLRAAVPGIKEVADVQVGELERLLKRPLPTSATEQASFLEDLKRSEVGKVVAQLKKHVNDNVRAKAQQVREAWSGLLPREPPPAPASNGVNGKPQGAEGVAGRRRQDAADGDAADGDRGPGAATGGDAVIVEAAAAQKPEDGATCVSGTGGDTMDVDPVGLRQFADSDDDGQAGQAGAS